MNIALTPKARKQTLGSNMLSRFRSLVEDTTDRGRPVKESAPLYSFLSECECPHDCLRDHENE